MFGQRLCNVNVISVQYKHHVRISVTFVYNKNHVSAVICITNVCLVVRTCNMSIIFMYSKRGFYGMYQHVCVTYSKSCVCNISVAQVLRFCNVSVILYVYKRSHLCN